jgi:hypothetical protein
MDHNTLHQLNCRINELQTQLYQLSAAILSQRISSVKQTYIAGAIINGGKAVMIDVDKKVYPFDILNPYHYDKFLGIAETAASAGQPVVIVTNGPSNVIGTGWGPGVGYYIGFSGFLTNIPPSYGLVKQVAVGIDVNTIIVQNVVEFIAL